MRNIISKIFFMLPVLGMFCANAQQDHDEAKKLLGNAFEKYQTSENLSFHIKYRYADEKDPSHYLDSLSGDYMIKGKSFRYEIANTIAIRNQDYTFSVFNDDKIIYLSKTVEYAHPLNFLNEELFKYVENSTIEKIKGKTIVELQFQTGHPYKKIKYSISERSGLFSSVILVTKAEEFFDPSIRSSVDQTSYALVEALMSDYSFEPVDESELDGSQFFKKEEKGFVSVGKYQAYQIFKGTVTLNK